MNNVESVALHTEEFVSGFLDEHVGEVTIQQSLILEDLGVARHAFAGARRNPPPLESLMFLRLIAEVALRLRWITAKVDVEPGSALDQIDRMRKGDMIALREAYKAIHAMNNSATTMLADLQAKIDEIAGPAAPTGLANLVTTDDAKGLYATHRMCSATIHAGSGAHRARLLPEDRAFHMSIGTMVTAVTWGSVGLAVLSHRYPHAWPDRALHALIQHYALVSAAGELDA